MDTVALRLICNLYLDLDLRLHLDLYLLSHGWKWRSIKGLSECLGEMEIANLA